MSVILSWGLIECVVSHQEPLPSTAYPILATLAEAIETATAELEAALEYEEVEEEEHRPWKKHH